MPFHFLINLCLLQSTKALVHSGFGGKSTPRFTGFLKCAGIFCEAKIRRESSAGDECKQGSLDLENSATKANHL